MEKILSDIQLAEVDVRYYEILASDAMRDRCHTLAYVWQKKVEEAKKVLERWQAELEMQALDRTIKAHAAWQEAINTPVCKERAKAIEEEERKLREESKEEKG